MNFILKFDLNNLYFPKYYKDTNKSLAFKLIGYNSFIMISDRSSLNTLNGLFLYFYYISAIYSSDND